MCYAFLLHENSHVLSIHGTDHTANTDCLYSKSMPVRTMTGNLLTDAKECNTATSFGMSMKRTASPAVHDDERPAKMGKMTDVSAGGEPQQLGVKGTGNDGLADAMEVDEASVVVAEDKSVLGGSGGDGGDGIGRDGKDVASEVGIAMSGSVRTEVQRLKQQLVEKEKELERANAELTEAKAKITRLQGLGRGFKDRFEAAQTKVVEMEVELAASREELSGLKGDILVLQNEIGASSATPKTKSGTAAARLKEQVKNVEQKANERWDKKMKKAGDDHAAKIAKLKKDHKQQLEKKESGWSEKLEELKAKHEEQQADTRKSCDAKRSEWRAKFNKLLGEARNEKDNAIESEKQAKKQFAEDVKALKAEQQAEIKKFKPDTADAVKDLKAQLSESNIKIERLKLAAAQHKDLAVKAMEGERDQKSRTAIATEMVEKARAEKDELMVELAARKQAYQDLAFHKQKVEEWKMRAEGHQRGVSSLNMALQSRDRALEKMRAELRAAFSENERLKEAEKRLTGELAGFLDEGCA